MSAEKDALRLAEESFLHSWDMSDERLIDGAWVAGLCCECGDFVPYGQEVAHVAAALAPLIDGAKAEAWNDGHNCCTYPICRDNPHRVAPPGEHPGCHPDGLPWDEHDAACPIPPAVNKGTDDE